MSTPTQLEIEEYIRQFLPLVDKDNWNTILVARKPGQGAVATLTCCEDLAGVLITVCGLLRNVEGICRQYEEEGAQPIADWLANASHEMEEHLGIEHDGMSREHMSAH